MYNASVSRNKRNKLKENVLLAMMPFFEHIAAAQRLPMLMHMIMMLLIYKQPAPAETAASRVF